MILMKNLTISEVIDNYYIIKCSKTLLEVEGHGLQQVAKRLNEKYNDKIRTDALEKEKSYTFTSRRSTAPSCLIGRQVQC